MRLAHIGLFAAGTDDVDVRQAARALAGTAATAPLLLIVAAAFDGAAQVAIWIVALAIDYVGGALRGIEGWRLSPGHFAERHSLIVIIALGESIVAIGVGAEESTSTPARSPRHARHPAVGGAVVDLLRRRAGAGRGAPPGPAGRARNTTARDSFSFLHLPLVAGIVLLALGVKKTLGDVDEPLKAVAAFGLCGGVALYLASDVAFRRRCLGLLDGQRLVAAAAAALALTPLAVELPALASLACVCAVAVALVAYETLRPSRASASPSGRPPR